MEQKVFFQAKDGIRLCGVWHLADKPTSKAIILAHGITSDKDESDIFVKLAETLSKNGYCVFRFDFRGHGESGGRSVDMTIKGETGDLEAVIDFVKSKKYSEIGVLGASFGGGIAILYAAQQQENLKCICLWNPCLDYDTTFINPSTKWLKVHKDRMKRELTELGWTTIGSKKLEVGKKLFEEMKVMRPYEKLSAISLPAIVIHGTSDNYVPFTDSKKYVNSLKNGKLVLIKDAEHGFHDTEKISNTVIQTTLKFFLKNL